MTNFSKASLSPALSGQDMSETVQRGSKLGKSGYGNLKFNKTGTFTKHFVEPLQGNGSFTDS